MARDVTRSRRALTLAASATLLGLPWTALARPNEYPSAPLRVVVPYPAGGFNDTLGRLVAKQLGAAWKVSAVVDNKPGGGTVIGTQFVASAPADGHTLLVIQFPFASNPWLYKLPYDTERAFAPVILAGRSPMVMVTHAASPYRTVADVITAARANPEKINYGTSGAGSSNHLAMVLFESRAGVRMNPVPYKGSAPLMTDLAGGHLALAVDLLPQVLPFIQSGKARALAIASPRRSPLLPDVPTAAEVGLSGYEVSSWHGFAVPSGTPQAVIDKLNGEINRILSTEEVQRAFAAQGVTPDGGSPAVLRDFIVSQMTLWKRVVEQHAIKVD
jgi:tripartite-type tricarboxylate transporter receptor subunit TctC